MLFANHSWFPFFFPPHCDRGKHMAMTSKAWSWMEDVLPFVAMLMITCLDMSILTIVKAAMNEGMDSIVYIVYHNALGTLIILPFFIVHNFRFVTLQLCLFLRFCNSWVFTGTTSLPLCGIFWVHLVWFSSMFVCFFMPSIK